MNAHSKELKENSIEIFIFWHTYALLPPYYRPEPNISIRIDSPPSGLGGVGGPQWNPPSAPDSLGGAPIAVGSQVE